MPRIWSLTWRLAAAAVLGISLGATGAWLEQFVGAFWIAVALIPVAWLLEAILEIGAGALGYGKSIPRSLVLFVLVACYIGAWVALRN